MVTIKGETAIAHIRAMLNMPTSKNEKLIDSKVINAELKKNELVIK